MLIDFLRHIIILWWNVRVSGFSKFEHLHQMHVCLIASFVKIITKHFAIVYDVYDSSQPGWFHVKTYMRVLGL